MNESRMKDNLTLDGEWRYQCTDHQLFRGKLMMAHQTYSSIARELGLTRERIRQFSGGIFIPTEYVDQICDIVECKPSDLALKRVWARRKPKVVRMWVERGCPRPQKEKLTTQELAEFLGYKEYKAKPQLIYNWVTNAGLPVHSKGGYRGLENIFLWEEVEEWLNSFMPPGGRSGK